MIEHNEHFDGICEKTISRASGFINNGLLTNFQKNIYYPLQIKSFWFCI